MSDAFQIFALTHSVVTQPAVVYRVTKEVIEDFAADGVVYLELRTVGDKQTPREAESMTKQEYLASVLQAISEAPKPIIVRLILSVNRALGLEAAQQSLSLASTSPLIVGLDFSGNPSLSSFQAYLPVFQSARQMGLKTTIHAAEIPDEAEFRAILEFGPERVGHCCCLSAECEAELMAARIPLEVCLSSNMGTLELSSLIDHHFMRFFEAKYPIAICTDDTAVFQTTLTQEYSLLAQHFGFTIETLQQISQAAFPFIFDTSPEVRSILSQIFSNSPS